MKKIALIFVLAAMLFSAHHVSALARVPFPNGKNLQPIPAYVAPNVSANVDATASPAESGSYNPAQQTNNANIPVQYNTPTHIGGSYLPRIILIAVIIIFVSLFVFLRKF